MKRAILLVGSIAGVLCAAADGLREISFMTAMPAEKAPVVDGVLDDACWAKGVPNRIYYKLDVPNPPRVALKTECTVMYDAKGVYVGIRNWEEDVSKLRKTHLKDWDASIWYDDGVRVRHRRAAHGPAGRRLLV